MKKLFLLIPALVLAIAMNAKEIEISSGTSNIIHYTIAAPTTEDGDVIVLTSDGDQPYFSTAGADDYTKLVKNLTIKAADGVHPVVKLEVPFRSTGGKTVKFIGITFDGTSLTSYDFYFRFYDANDNLEFEDCEFKNISKYVFDVYTGKSANSLKLTNCKLHDISSRGILNRGTLTSLEINGGQIYNFTGYPVLDNYDGATLGKVKINGTEFYNNAKDIISGVATSHADSCIINNCYFHNNSRSAVYFAASSVDGVETCDGVIVKNSTFANNNLSASDRSVIEVQNYGATEAANIEVTVDHCTFYNNTTKNFDYSCIRSRKSTKVNITNSIFAYPSAIDFYATNCYGGTISNTLVYNLSRGHRVSSNKPAVTNTITADPKFNDLANNRYTFDGNWSTGSISPAREAATDGSDLGDPRWYSDETLPNVDFATPRVLDGLHAQLSGSFALNGDNNIQSQDKTYAGIARWKIHATRKCIVEVTLNIADANTSGHRYEVAFYDANNVLVGTALAEPENSWSHGDKVLGIYEIPAVGDYTIKLTNDCNNSSTIIEGVTLTYTGGAVQNIATDANTTLNVADAWFSGCTRDNDYIQYPSSGTASAWIKWNIATSETKYYDLTVNINTEYAHGFTIAIYEDEDAEPITSVTEGTYVNTKGVLALELGRINLAGEKNYVVKVTNAPSGSQAKVANVVFAPVTATATTLPNTLEFNNAVLSEKAFIQDGMLYFNEIGDTNPQGQWAQWEVTTDHAGKFLFTLNATSTNGQKYKITILDSGNNEVDSYEENFESGDKTMKHFFVLAAGTYYVKVENTRSYSKGHLTSLVVTEPEVITLDEAATSFTYQTGVKHYQLIRTLKAGMYNTFCSPLKLTSDVCEAVFGEDVEIYTLKEAIADGAVLNVELKSEYDIWQGTPVFIRPSHDIVNPIFIDVEMMAENPASTTKTNANFVGTFVKTTLTGGDNILYLGPDNTLYYPEVDTPIKGMRGWFVIHDAPVAAPMIKRMRIVENTNVVTDVELVETENNAIKTIENGQLVITIDGVRYNVMGAKIQ